MKITIISVVKRKDDQPERPVLGTPHSLTVTFGRWTDKELVTYMINYHIDTNIRKLSREQLGRLTRDIVYAVAFDPIWKDEFAVYAVKHSSFEVDYFPRILAEGTDPYASWDWGNKWSLLGDMSPTHFRNFESDPIREDDRFDPDYYTDQELRTALECATGLFTSYTRGLLRGQMEWSELDELYDSAQKALPRLHKSNLLLAAASYHPLEEWRQEVANGDTRLGYEAWLTHQLDSKEPTQ